MLLKPNSRTASAMVTESATSTTVTSMRVDSSTTSTTVRASSLTRLEDTMTVTGRMDSPLVMLPRYSRAKMSTLVSLSRVSLMAKVNANTPMATSTMDSGSRTLLLVRVLFIMQTEMSTLVTGIATKELMVTSGSRMVVSIGLSTKTRRLLDLTSVSTPTELSLKVLLLTARSMVVESTLSLLELFGKEPLKMTFFREVVTSLKAVNASKLLSKTMPLHQLMEKYPLMLLKEDSILPPVGMKAIWSTVWHKEEVFSNTLLVNLKATDTKVRWQETDLMVTDHTLSRLVRTRKPTLVSSSTVE